MANGSSDGDPTTRDVEAESREAAESAGLVYVTDERPGITRKGAGKGFAYYRPDGAKIVDTAERKRIDALAVPPAYADVWICPDPRGHLQATGRDDRGRKQYRYHEAYRAARDQAKYEHVIEFGDALPTIHAKTAEHLRKRGLPREKVLAAVVTILEKTLIRVGNDEYAEKNDSYGLTTLQDDHATIRGGKIRFEFTGKSGVEHGIDLKDKRLARIAAACQDLPGQELFQYLADDGTVVDVKSDDVNAYLREITGRDFTAKDFRTWAGTVLAAVALREFEAFDSEAQAKKNVVAAVERVAERLGNTKAVCRKCYIHPAVIETYMDGDLADRLRVRAEEELADHLSDLPPEEAAVLTMLRASLDKPANKKRGGTKSVKA